MAANGRWNEVGAEVKSYKVCRKHLHYMESMMITSIFCNIG